MLCLQIMQEYQQIWLQSCKGTNRDTPWSYVVSTSGPTEIFDIEYWNATKTSALRWHYDKDRLRKLAKSIVGSHA